MVAHHKTVRSFRRDRAGGVAISAAFLLIPIMGVMALAAGYSTASSQRSALQQLIDSSAIALARDPDIDRLPPGELDARALKYAKNVSSGPALDDLVIHARVTAGDVIVDAEGSVPMVFGGLIGQDKLAVKSSVTVSRASSRSLEIALALDNTGSMNESNKIKELKSAVKAMVTYMSDPAKNKSPTKMAMVPFANYVRARPADISDTILNQPKPKNWDGCLTDREEPFNASDTAPSPGNEDSKFDWGIWTQHRQDGGHRRKSRKDHGDGGNSYTETYDAVDCGSLAEMIPLTSSLSTISTAADRLTASGSTNVTIGVSWGMHALMPGEPLTQGSPEGTQDLMRALIVLTDGENTEDRWGDNNDGAIDARTLAACTAAKAKGITVITIRLIEGNASLLQSCASGTENYYAVSKASELTPLFEQISGQLAKLRIAR